MSKFLISFLLIVFLSISVFSGSDEETYGNVTLSEVTSIYDGDTFRGTIKDYPPILGYRISIRIYGIDCPELKDKNPKIKSLALQAKQYTVQRLREGKEIKLVDMRRDKYFRICAKVLIDGKDLGQELIKKGLAKPYDGGTKEKWE